MNTASTGSRLRDSRSSDLWSAAAYGPPRDRQAHHSDRRSSARRQQRGFLQVPASCFGKPPPVTKMPFGVPRPRRQTGLPKAAEIEHHGLQHVHVRLAAVCSPSADRPAASVNDQTIAAARRRAPSILWVRVAAQHEGRARSVSTSDSPWAITHRLLRAGLCAVRCKISSGPRSTGERSLLRARLIFEADRIGGAGLEAGLTAVGAKTGPSRIGRPAGTDPVASRSVFGKRTVRWPCCNRARRNLSIFVSYKSCPQ